MAVRTSLMEFQIPKIVHEEIDENRGIFQIEPLDRGFGYTFGNSLRRVLLSSLEGAAVTSVKIEGVAHEFTTLPGVREDVTDILLNFKNLIARLHGDSPEIEVRLSKRGAGAVTAKDIEAPAELEILNPDLEIANLSDKGKLEVTLTIGRGRGYVPAELNRGPEHTIGVIPVDSIFSPVRRVSYDVEAARVGQRTDYDKLILDVTTDGSLDPRDSIGQAAEWPPSDETPAGRQEAGAGRRPSQGALRQPDRVADRARPDQDHRREGEGGPAGRGGDDHARAARRCRRPAARPEVPALAGGRAQAVQRRRAQVRRPARRLFADREARPAPGRRGRDGLPRARRLHAAGLTAHRRSEQASQPGADRRDRDSGERDDPERADERVLEEAPAEVGEQQQLRGDHCDREEERHRVVRDQERQGVEDSAE